MNILALRLFANSGPSRAIELLARRRTLTRCFATSSRFASTNGYVTCCQSGSLPNPRLLLAFRALSTSTTPLVKGALIRQGDSEEEMSSNIVEQQHGSVSLYKMDQSRIAMIESVSELAELVGQLEAMPTLIADDVTALMIPLQKAIRDRSPDWAGADLVERILFSCLSRLPPPSASLHETPWQDSSLPFPTTHMYTNVLIAWGNTKSADGAKRADRIFDFMKTEHNNARQALFKASRDGGLTVTADLMRDLQRRAPSPCWKCYKSVIRAWALSDSIEGPAKASDYLLKLEKQSGIPQILTGNIPPPESWDGSGLPDRSTYNMVLMAYARTYVLKHPHALERIKTLVARMDQLHQVTGFQEFALDFASFHAILRAYDKYAAYAAPPLAPQWSQEIEGFLHRLTENLDSQQRRWQHADKHRKLGSAENAAFSLSWAYGVAVGALVKTPPFASTTRRAHDILNAMAGKQNSSGFRLPASSENVFPTQDTIIKVIRSWEKSGLPEAEESISRLLRLAVEAPMERLYFLNKAMEEWAGSGWENAPDLVEAMLERAIEHKVGGVKPNGQSFSIALKAWVQSRSNNAPYRAELLLQRMIELYEETGDSSFRPRDVHLKHVLTSWLNRCRTGRRYPGIAGTCYPAEHMEWLLTLVERSNWIKNNTGHYGMVLRAWANQKLCGSEINPVERATRVLRSLEELEGVLPAFPCNWVLEVCKRKQTTPARRKKAYDVAIDTFKRGKRNSRSFVLMVEVIRAQVGVIDDEHLEIIQFLFNECCASGLLSQEMVWHVAEVVSSETMQKLFGISYQHASFVVQARESVVDWGKNPPKSLLVSKLPEYWSRNMKQEKP